MRRTVAVFSVLGLLVLSLGPASIADARVGGGGSSGSRGSRSYSAPRSPSAPVSPGLPGSPASPSRPLGPQSGPQRPGGLLGGLGGMLGGLVLGGLLGSLLFGGMGGGFGGFGLLELALVAGLVYLAFAFLRRRAPVPAVAAPGGGPSAATLATPEAPAATHWTDQDLDRGVGAIRMMDPDFDPARFAPVATDLFHRLQGAWSARDLAPVRTQLTDELAGALEADVARLKAQRRVNRIEKPSVEAVVVSEAWQEYGKDFVTVQIRARVVDWTVDEASGAVLAGDPSTPVAFEEYWTFTRPVGPHPWQLSAIHQPSA